MASLPLHNYKTKMIILQHSTYQANKWQGQHFLSSPLLLLDYQYSNFSLGKSHLRTYWSSDSFQPSTVLSLHWSVKPRSQNVKQISQVVLMQLILRLHFKELCCRELFLHTCTMLTPIPHFPVGHITSLPSSPP